MSTREHVALARSQPRDARFVPPAHGFASYEEAASRATPSVPLWFKQMRLAGLETFRQLGFPTKRLEDWKYTDTTPIAREAFRLSPRPSDTALPRELRQRAFLPGCATLVFVQGWPLATQASEAVSPGQVRLLSLHDALAQEEAHLRHVLGSCAPASESSFTALNTALLDQGAYVRVAKGTRLATPIQLLFIGGFVDQPVLTCPRNLIVLGDDAEATVIEWWTGRSSAPFLTNEVTEIILGKRARLVHVRVVEEQGEMLHMGLASLRQSEGSTYNSQVLTFPGKWTRVELHTRLEAEGATALLDGLFVAQGQSFVDHHTTVDHLRGTTTSRQLYKGILDDSSHGVFNGKVFVRPGALKSDAQQMNKNLLLSDDAEIDTKPQLEIFADDVKCSHGATIGQLDDQALFYLRARGIAAEEARRLLIYGFAHEIVERVPLEAAQGSLRAILRQRLAGAPLEDPS